MKNKSHKQWLSGLCLILGSCSPLKSSPNDEKHQLELTLRGLQTNVDDLQHDLNCFRTEVQILDGRIKYYENTLSSLKQQEIERQQQKIEQILVQLGVLEKKLLSFEQSQVKDQQHLQKLADATHEVVSSVSQCKERLLDLEQMQRQKLDEIGKLKGYFETLSKQLGASSGKIYKVRSGDSLEKIARLHKTTVDKIKKANNLEQDLIVTGQELHIEP